MFLYVQLTSSRLSKYMVLKKTTTYKYSAQNLSDSIAISESKTATVVSKGKRNGITFYYSGINQLWSSVSSSMYKSEENVFNFIEWLVV